MKIRLPIAAAVAVAAAVLAIAGLASGAAGGGKLRCFADAPATCTLNSATSATLDTTQGGDAGVYLSNGKATGGTPVANAGFSFQYFCANTTDYTSCVGGGAPRWSIPINVGNDPKDTHQVYAFLDANGCGDDGTVSTDEADCAVTLNAGGSYPNWATFAAANPTYTIANALPFVISDVTTGGKIIVMNLTSHS
jgi:hypothetical protein